MEAPNQNPEINSKFKVGDIAYIRAIPIGSGKLLVIGTFYRIDGIEIHPTRQGFRVPFYIVTILHSNGTVTDPIRRMKVSYFDSRATLVPAGSMMSAGPNGGRKSYRNLKKRKTRKSRKTRKNRRRRV
jgi:hypothetical protein